MLPPPRPIAPAPGGQLELNDIVGRDEDVARFWDALTRQSLVLNEPRRLGKTLALRKLCSLPPDGWTASYRSYQGVDTTIGMAEALIGELLAHRGVAPRAKDRIKGFARAGSATVKVEGIEFSLAPQFRDDPIVAMSAALLTVTEHLGDRGLVLVCDEVPDMIAAIAKKEGPEAALKAVAMWRRWREQPGAERVRWFLTGSVGFHHVLRTLDSDDLINDLLPIDLGPLGADWTTWLAASVLMGSGVEAPNDEAVNALAELSGGFAMIIHMVGATVRDKQPSVVDGAYLRGVLASTFGNLDASQQFTSFLTRLAPYYGDDEKRAYWILDELAKGPLDRVGLLSSKKQKFRDEEHLRKLLDWLTSDHYLQVDDSSVTRMYTWRYEPLRLLWTLRRR
jgi:hypothetical protein